MKKLLIDLYRTKDPYSGLGQFSQQFAEALIARNPPMHSTFLVPKGYAASLLPEQRFLSDGVLVRHLPALAPRFDLWHSLHQLPSHRPPRGTAWVYTVHDLNFLIEKTAAKAQRYLNRLQRDLDRATAITAISHHTKAQLERHADLKGREVRVIHNGVRLPLPGHAPLPAGVGTRPFFLSVGVLKEKKSIHALLPLMAHFPDHDLVIAGNDRTAYGERIRREAAALHHANRIHLLGAVEDDTRNSLYAHCEALLFPSLAEGFGLPVIEALALGKPVFASRSTSLPEIGGDIAFYFDDLDPERMAGTLREGLATWRSMGPDAARRAQRHAARFTWELCINGYLAVYDEVLGR